MEMVRAALGHRDRAQVGADAAAATPEGEAPPFDLRTPEPPPPRSGLPSTKRHPAGGPKAKFAWLALGLRGR